MLTVRVVVLELHRTSYFVSLEALKMCCVMRASVPSLYNVYRRYDTQVFRTMYIAAAMISKRVSHDCEIRIISALTGGRD